MPVSSIAQIFIRLYAIKIFVQALASLVGLLFTAHITTYGISGLLIALLPNLLVVTIGAAIWVTAPWLSKLLARGGDEPATLQGVTREDLFASIFLGLGVYFTLQSFSNVFGWLHYFTVNHLGGVRVFHKGIPSYYDLVEKVLTMTAGIALILTCQTWARRMTADSRGER